MYARMIFCKHFTDMNITHEVIGRHLGINHSSVSYMKKRYPIECEVNLYFKKKADAYFSEPLFNFAEKDTEQLF